MTPLRATVRATGEPPARRRPACGVVASTWPVGSREQEKLTSPAWSPAPVRADSAALRRMPTTDGTAIPFDTRSVTVAPLFTMAPEPGSLLRTRPIFCAESTSVTAPRTSPAFFSALPATPLSSPVSAGTAIMGGRAGGGSAVDSRGPRVSRVLVGAGSSEGERAVEGCERGGGKGAAAWEPGGIGSSPPRLSAGTTIVSNTAAVTSNAAQTATAALGQPRPLLATGAGSVTTGGKETWEDGSAS